MILENLGKYHVWAGQRMREILNELTDDEFARDLGEPFGTVRAMTEHIVLALEICFAIVNDELNTFEERASYILRLTNQNLLKRWEERDQDLAKGFASHPTGSVEVGHFPTPFSLNLADFYFQYVNHTTYHRAQLIFALKMLNKPTVGTDYLFYFDELNQQASELT